MRFARVISAHDQRNSSVDRLVETAELDVLQLDYRWPSQYPAGSIYAPGLLQQLRTLHKTIYLDPSLHLITDAGGGNPLGCAEAVGQFLCEHGDADLPLTTIRGDNLLPQLEELLAEGIELRDIATGTTLSELTQSLLAAQVELGAGPLATALNEGSRLILAGCYDLAAPAIATAVCALRWSWEQVESLAPLAVAAQLPQTLLDLDEEKGLTVQAYLGETLDQEQLRQALLQTAEDGRLIRHADVGCEISNFELQQKTSDTFQITGVTGQTTLDRWLLRLTYEAGYVAEATFECRGDRTTREIAEEMLGTLLDAEADELRTIRIGSHDFSGEDASSWIRVGCQSRQSDPCEEFVRDIKNISVQSKIPGCGLMFFMTPLQQQIKQTWCEIPREAVAVSVDTRPAKEWR